MAQKPAKGDAPVLLSGGNPQIAKGDGDAPVQAYIAAMPGWKSAAWARLDRLIEREVPGVLKAVKWNSPLYGAPDALPNHWFLSIHCYDKYIKVAFFDGKRLAPVPPVASKSGQTAYFHIHEADAVDEEAFADWVRQAILLSGEKL